MLHDSAEEDSQAAFKQAADKDGDREEGCHKTALQQKTTEMN